jgi:pyruvate/2-oxoglutarate dehydrogenase complex dihydrolipoamide dehydrogenase (E3) component
VADYLTPDLCIIGAGSGGLSVAAAAAMMGVSVVLIEKHRMGGDCLNVGCVPSKALIAAGHHAASARKAKQFGLAVGEPRIDFAKVHDHVHSVIRAIEPNDTVERFTALGVKVIKGEAHFIDKRTVMVADTSIRARRFVIATGSQPAIPAIPGIDSVPYLTNETVFDLVERPARLAIIGAGPIGLELAQAFRRLGSDVVVITQGEALSKEDPEAANIVVTALERDGVVIHRHTAIERVEMEGARIRIHCTKNGVKSIENASNLLIATGRKVVADRLGLDAAGIRANAKGIEINAKLKTANARVYAIGDCAGGPNFTHAANYHAGLVIRSALFRLPVKADYTALPRVTFTDPEIAAVGLNEEEARKADKALSILRWPFAENDRAQAERTIEGLIKVLVGKKGRILGVSIAGPHAGELLTPWVLAMKNKLPVTAMNDIVFAYPTLSEVSKRVAVTYLTPKLRSPWLPRILKFMRMFG